MANPPGHPQLSPFSQPSAAGINVSESSPKKLAPVAMCKHGQELVHDVVQKTYEIFGTLKTMPLPLAQNLPQIQDRKSRFEDLVHRTEGTFQKLHFIYDSACSVTQNVERSLVESFLVTGDHSIYEMFGQDANNREPARSDEEQRLIEQISTRNQQIKEVIDKMRLITWKIDAMAMLRKSF